MAEQVDLTEEEINHMIAETDEDKNGEVSFDGKKYLFPWHLSYSRQSFLRLTHNEPFLKHNSSLF